MARAKLERLGIGDSGRPASGEHLIHLLGTTGIRDADHLLERFRERLTSESLPVFRDRGRALACLAAKWPGLDERTRERARRIEGGRFDLLGHHGLDFGDPIDWHFDPTRDRRAPQVHWSRVRYLDLDVVGDHKVVWELNRHSYFIALGQAYWLTSDERWAALFVEHVDSWMASNPPKMGVNWASSLEVAFRSISWLWALHFFARSEHLTADWFAGMVACLRLHGRHVEAYVSTYFSPNTHLTGEALGLVYLGSLLPELPEAERWRSRGREWLMGALEFQIRPDGGYFEQSTHYHRYTVDFYLHLLLLCRISGETPPRGLEDRLDAMADHLVAIVRPDGRIPLIGDDDAGRLVFLDDRATADVRSTILAAAVMLDRPDWVAVGGAPSEEIVWLLGPDAVDALNRQESETPPAASRALRDTGLFVFRSNWDRTAEYAIIRCGPHGALGGGHAHADALSIELGIDGEPLLVDPGTGSYVDPEVRDELRSTAAHNTVTVAGLSSSTPGGPFGWETRAESVLHEWIITPDFGFFEGSHDGYERLERGLRHKRMVLWVPGDYWVIRDSVFGFDRVPPAARAVYRFSPHLEVRLVDERTVEASRTDGRVLARAVSLLGSAWEATEGRVSPVYGDVRASRAWVIEGAPGDSHTVEVVTLISPRPLPVTEVAAKGGRVWRIGADDLLVFGAGGDTTVRTADGVVETDFRCVWHRSGADGAPGSLLAVGGRRLALEARSPLELPAAVRHISLAGGLEPVTVPAAEGDNGVSASVSDWWRRGQAVAAEAARRRPTV